MQWVPFLLYVFVNSFTPGPNNIMSLAYASKYGYRKTLMFILGVMTGTAIRAGGQSFMKPRITVITLGVDDLERSLGFYRDGLGLPTEGIVGQEFEHGAVAFFELQAALTLAIWNRKDLAHDAQLPLTASSPTACSIGHNVDTLDIFKTRMVTCGKWYGIRNGCYRNNRGAIKTAEV